MGFCQARSLVVSTNEFKGLEGFPSKPFFVGYTKEYTNEIRVDGDCYLGDG